MHKLEQDKQNHYQNHSLGWHKLTINITITLAANVNLLETFSDNETLSLFKYWIGTEYFLQKPMAHA